MKNSIFKNSVKEIPVYIMLFFAARDRWLERLELFEGYSELLTLAEREEIH